MRAPRPQYQREYQRAWMAKRRREIVAQLGGACAQCGSAERLEIDHIERSSKVSHRINGWSKVRRGAELAKCQLLCAPCHRKKTSAENRRLHAEQGLVICRCQKCIAKFRGLDIPRGAPVVQRVRR